MPPASAGWPKKSSIETTEPRDITSDTLTTELCLETVTHSIVVPAYNESERISAALERVLAYTAKCGWNAEVIVVNDGSQDATADIVRALAEKNPALRLLENPGNRGKGYSVRNGMLHAHGQVLLFSDADFSSPIEEAGKLFGAIAAGADIAIGSRWLQTELQVRKQPLHRQLFGRMFNLALRLVLGLHFKDTQCGFKAFTRRAASTVFPLQNIERWGFDPELLYLAKKFELKIVEVPVAWAHRDGTRLNPIPDGIRMLGEMFRIRWNSWSGKYPAVAHRVTTL
jgi:dolichyl-phosphate beta-glucosyltransferase